MNPYRDPPGYRGKHSRKISDDVNLAWCIGAAVIVAFLLYLVAAGLPGE